MMPIDFELARHYNAERQHEAAAFRLAAATHKTERAFCRLLLLHRRGANLTQERLAERAGSSVRGLQHLEAGEARPFRATLRTLWRHSS